MKLRAILALLAAAAATAAGPARPCTTFVLDAPAGAVVGKNYDWDVDDGLVIVNKRGVSKTALVRDNAATWTSKYGSITFNQHGREFPLGGMNEAGLAVEVMWLNETQYEAADGRPALDNQQWLQYQLDNFATVAEVVAAFPAVRIADANPARIHYLVADRAGDAAAVEFVGGEAAVHTGTDMPYKALTNNTYDDSAAFLAGVGAAAVASAPELRGDESLPRFGRAACGARDFAPPGDAVGYAFGILADVAQADWTQWSIVYDLGAARAYYRTRANGAVRHADLAAFDLSAATPVKVLDVNAAGEGDVAASFTDYTYAANRKLIDDAFAAGELTRDVPADVREMLARYPETTTPAE